jgi:hypothetical protein
MPVYSTSVIQIYLLNFVHFNSLKVTITCVTTYVFAVTIVREKNLLNKSHTYLKIMCYFSYKIWTKFADFEKTIYVETKLFKCTLLKGLSKLLQLCCHLVAMHLNCNAHPLPRDQPVMQKIKCFFVSSWKENLHSILDFWGHYAECIDVTVL